MADGVRGQNKVPDEDNVFQPISGLDYKLRSFSMQYVRANYETNFMTNFKEQSFRILKQVAGVLMKEKLNKQQVHEQMYASFYKNEPIKVYSSVLQKFPTLPQKGIKDINIDLWRYVYSFFALQAFLVDEKKHSSRLFPISSVETVSYTHLTLPTIYSV